MDNACLNHLVLSPFFAMADFNIPEAQYDIIPFPISCPEHLLQYVPKDAVYYMGIYDAWDEEKYKILTDLGLKVEVYSPLFFCVCSYDNISIFMMSIYFS